MLIWLLFALAIFLLLAAAFAAGAYTAARSCGEVMDAVFTHLDLEVEQLESILRKSMAGDTAPRAEPDVEIPAGGGKLVMQGPIDAETQDRVRDAFLRGVVTAARADGSNAWFTGEWPAGIRLAAGAIVEGERCEICPRPATLEVTFPDESKFRTCAGCAGIVGPGMGRIDLRPYPGGAS